jgi:hypothetical protein
MPIICVRCVCKRERGREREGEKEREREKVCVRDDGTLLTLMGEATIKRINQLVPSFFKMFVMGC